MKSDDHAFTERHTQITEEIIDLLLDKQLGNDFRNGSDAVSIAINSPRGHCLEALINLTLRLSRISDKRHNKNHKVVWERFKPRFDIELQRANSKLPEYEFSTLVTYYLPNFLYMSNDWVMENLHIIFSQDNYLKWICAIRGYACVGVVYEPIFRYLKEHGDLLKVLDDETLKDKVKEKVVQNIVVAYLNNFDDINDKNSLINVLIQRNDSKELRHLIWFIWTLRKEGDLKLRDKVYEIWPKILGGINTGTRDGRCIASNLCHWSAFVDTIDDERRELLLTTAPYAEESYNSYELLKNIANNSKSQPFEASTIWKKMLEGSSPDYPEDAIRELFTSLINEGSKGKRMAREIEDEYLRKGSERPSIWLREIIAAQHI